MTNPFHLRRKLRTARHMIASDGFSAALRHASQKTGITRTVEVMMAVRKYPLFWEKILPCFSTYAIRSPHARHLLHCRKDTSDASMFKQVFDWLEYDCFGNIPAPEFIVDCGANVGYTSAFFLTQFPSCRVVAIEPDPENFKALARNLKPYGDRVQLLNTGVWSHSTGLVIHEIPYRDGSACARQVRECRPGETPAMKAVGIEDILKESSFDTVSILKVDIERAEIVLFSKGCESWLPKIRNIAIELHDAQCEDIFHRAIADMPFAISRRGELTICTAMPQGAHGA